MDDLDLESLPEFIWIKNPKGMIVEVAKEKLPTLLKEGAKIVSETDGVKQNEVNVPRAKSQKVYLNVEEL